MEEDFEDGHYDVGDLVRYTGPDLTNFYYGFMGTISAVNHETPNDNDTYAVFNSRGEHIFSFSDLAVRNGNVEVLASPPLHDRELLEAWLAS